MKKHHSDDRQAIAQNSRKIAGFDAFDDTMKRLVQVPKKELDDEIKKHRKKKLRRRKK